MNPTPDNAAEIATSALRRAATALILSQLNSLVEQEVDWLAVTRKRIKDRMSDAKHIMFNNDLKLRVIEGQLEKGTASAGMDLSVKSVIQQHQILTDKIQELGRIAEVCALALSILDRQGGALPNPRHVPSRRVKSGAAVKLKTVAANSEHAEVEASA